MTGLKRTLSELWPVLIPVLLFSVIGFYSVGAFATTARGTESATYSTKFR